MKKTNTHVIIAALLALGMLGRLAAVPAFPGAEGFGSTTPGGRGTGAPTPTVYIVTSLADSSTPQVGELRYGVENTSGPRIIVFQVAGVINLTKNLKIRRDRPYITIAGQTAPPPGITLRNAGFDVQTHDVLVQHLAVRPGARLKAAPWTDLQPYNNRKAVLINPTATTGDQIYNVVFDHVSISWGTDENVTIDANNNPIHDITVSHSLDYEALRFCGVDGNPATGAYLGHPDVYRYNATTGFVEKIGIDGHSAGFYVYNGARQITVAKDVFAFNRWRNPVMAGNSESAVDGYAFPTDVHIANNYIYAPGENNGHRIDMGVRDAPFNAADMNQTRVSIAGNMVYLNANYTTYPTFTGAGGAKYGSPATNAIRTVADGTNPGAPDSITAYFDSNKLHASTGWVSSSPYAAPIFSAGKPVTTVLASNPLADGVTMLSGSLTEQQFEDQVLAQAGSRPLVRDMHDRRIIKQIKDRKDRDWTDLPSQSLTTPSFATDIDTSQLDADGYPVATGYHDINLSLSQISSLTADSDSDGWLDVEEWIHAWSKFVEGTASGTLSAEVAILDNFEESSISGWTTSGGTWVQSAVGVASTPEANKVYEQTNSATTARAILGNTNWIYQTVQAEMKPVTLGATFAFGVLGHYRDVSNYYHLVLKNGNVLELRRMVTGTQTVLASASVPFTISTADTYRFKLVLDGPQLVGAVERWNSSTFTWVSRTQVVGFDASPLVNGSAGLSMTNARVQSNCVLAAPSIEERYPFGDDFESGSSHWTSAATASWAVVTDGSHVYRQTDLTAGAATFCDASIGDQIVETQLKFISVADPLDRWVGLMARYTDENNYYYTTLRSNGASSRIALKKIVGGVVAADLDSANYTVTVPATYQMRLEVVGSTLNAYLGDRRVLEAYDTSLSQGKQGVRMYKATAQFDDFTTAQPKN